MTGILPIASARRTRQAAFRLLARRKWRLVLVSVLLLVGTATSLLVPWLLGIIVDVVIDGGAPATLVWCALAILGAGLAGALFQWWGGVELVQCLQDALSELREDVFVAAVSLESGAVEDAGSSDIVSRVTGDVEAVTEAVAGVLPRVLQAGFTIALTAVGLSLIDPWLVLAALAAAPVQVLVTVRFLRRSRPLYSRLRREEAARGQALIEAVAGADTVRAHATQDSHLGGVGARSLVAVETQREAARERNVFHGGLNLAEYLALAGVLVVGFVAVASAGMTIGAVLTGALFVVRLFAPMGSLLGSIDDLQRAFAGVERMVGVVLAAPRRAADRTEIGDPGVSVRSVRHRYASGPGRDALVGVDVDIAPGATAVFVGASGSGKSTLGRLVAGIAEPSAGEVRVGGVPASRATRSGKPAVLLITQETHLFTGTVADNLRLAAPEADDRRLADVLEATGVESAEALLPTTSSGATSHRLMVQISLARVLLADPAIVVLDEVTAGSAPDDVLAEAVRAVSRGRTAIVIAHDLAQARDADVVVVFEGGRIVEQGSFDEVRANPGGVFAGLWRAFDGD